MAARRRDRLRRVPTPVAASAAPTESGGAVRDQHARHVRPTSRGARPAFVPECRCPPRPRPSAVPTENGGPCAPDIARHVRPTSRGGCGRHLCRMPMPTPVAAKRRSYGKRGPCAPDIARHVRPTSRGGSDRHLRRNPDAHPGRGQAPLLRKAGGAVRAQHCTTCAANVARGAAGIFAEIPMPIPVEAKRCAYGHPRSPVGAASAAKAAALHCPSALLDAFPRRRGFSRKSAALRCAVLPARARQPAPGRASRALPGLRHAPTPRRLCVEPGR